VSKWPYSTQRWQRLRKYKLQQNPLCEACLQLGYIEPAVAVDHRKPISAGGELYPAIEKLASLCERCHNMKTRYEQLGEAYMRKGCDVFGRPLDPDHAWYKEPRK
jgi:5-methylcytosine-specific restriction protein A